MELLFSSITFLYTFLPAVLLVYYLVPKQWKNTVLLVFSLVFYAWGEKQLVLLFVLSILLNWLAAGLMEHGNRRLIASLIIIFDLSVLFYFKYMDFFLGSINQLLGSEFPPLHIALPIGISFYTFQLIGYVADVYRKDIPPQKNLIDFAAYVSFFPQLIAGPIVRYTDVSFQLKDRRHTIEKVSSGIRRFIIGLGKKVLIANPMGEVCAAFHSSNDISVFYYWLYGICFAIQIYYDFSGYSDMAIGLGRIFGFDFMENFQYPYISGSITEFWRRWHISLGTWFRDYVYIPLGGNRNGKWKQLRNIMIVWLLTGLWHGAAWNFIVWGLIFAVLLTIEKLGFKQWLEQHPILRHIYVLFFILISFIVFQADNMEQAISDITGLFAIYRLPILSIEAVYMLRSNLGILLLAAVGAVPIGKTIAAGLSEKYHRIMQYIEPLLLTCLLLLVTAYLIDGSFNPFLYFRF